MNSDAIKEFLFRHFEKFIFGVLTLLAVFLIYQGVNKPDISAKHQPDKMEAQARQVKLSIDDDHWSAIKDLREVTIDIVGETNKTIQPVDPTVYKLPHPWEVKPFDSGIKRTDPKLPSPIDIQVTGVIASLAIKAPGDYPLKVLEPADPAVKVEKKKPPKPKKLSRMEQQAMMMSGGSSMESMSMESHSMETSTGSGMMDPRMAGMAAGKPIRKIDSKLYDQGFRPTTATDVAPAIWHFIAGVALMPQKKIFDEFELALSQSEGYNTQRDLPYYIDFELQRADVTVKPVDQLTDADWMVRGSSRYYQMLLLRKWAGMAKEIVAGKYRDPELTAAIPPVLLDNYAWFASHPKIPLGDEPLTGATSVVAPKQDLPLEPLVPGAVTSPSRRGRTGGLQMQSSMGSPEMSNMMMNPNGMMVKVEQPEFKLIRFYDGDFTRGDTGAPQPGRKYVYRVRIAVEDPNFPENPALQPRNATLSADAFKRVDQLTMKAAELAKTNPAVPRDQSLWMKWSDYSAPSSPVSLPSIYDSYAGPVDPGAFKSYQLDANTQIEFSSKPPKAKVVVNKWDSTYGSPIPVFVEASRGTVVSKEKATFEVPDPITLEIRKTPESSINTANVVLDIVGGRALSISPAENQTEPGLLLMFDPSGGLEVVDEIETQRGYRLYSFADEREE